MSTLLDRYRREDGVVVIQIAVKSSRQLFNESDPAPFRERDLDDDFVTYVVNSVQEFPLATKMKLEVIVSGENHDAIQQPAIDPETVCQAIQTFFEYEAKMSDAKIRTRLRTARFFLMVGFAVLFVCLGTAQFIAALGYRSPVANIIREGFIISGWVAMWRPIELLLYGWWPIREQRRYFEKISKLDIKMTLRH